MIVYTTSPIYLGMDLKSKDHDIGIGIDTLSSETLPVDLVWMKRGDWKCISLRVRGWKVLFFRGISICLFIFISCLFLFLLYLNLYFYFYLNVCLLFFVPLSLDVFF